MELSVVISVLEYIGVFAFAASGAVVAIQEQYDLFGIYCIACVTAMGGGVLRDIVTDVGIPAFFTSYMTLPVIFVSATMAIYLRGRWEFNHFFVTLDALGLAAFVVSAGLKAIASGYNIMVFLFAAAITGVGGGILRDILTNRKPQVFQFDIYSVAGLVGALFLWFAHPYLGIQPTGYIALVLIVLIRMFCYLNNIHLPVVRYTKTSVAQKKREAEQRSVRKKIRFRCKQKADKI